LKRWFHTDAFYCISIFPKYQFIQDNIRLMTPRSRLTFSIVFITALLSSQPVWSGGPASDSGRDMVSRQVDSLIYECLPKGTDVALYVYDLSARQPVYSYRADVMCRPASVQKVITGAVALETLGPDFQFETRLSIRGAIKSDGTLDGDAYLVGGLDPALMETDLMRMATELKNAGVRHISGSLVADVSLMDSVSWGPGWCWDDAPSSFQPFISPLLVHGGYLQVQVVPGAKGKPATVNLFPQNSFIKVDNRSVSLDKNAGALEIETDWTHGDNTVRISGNVSKAQSVELSIRPSHWFALNLFKEYLGQEGITVANVCYGQCPAISQTVWVVSHSLTDILKHAMKESDNLYAECMFLRSGKVSTQYPVTFEKASKYTQDFIERKFGLKQTSYNIVDGSGLSMYDFMSPSFMVDILTLVYHSPSLYPAFLDALPVSGMDGTLKGRLGSRNTIGKVHAKTGTVTGACTLAGYVQTRSGHTLAFSIMNGGAVKTAPSRKFQDQLCEVLVQL